MLCKSGKIRKDKERARPIPEAAGKGRGTVTLGGLPPLCHSLPGLAGLGWDSSDPRPEPGRAWNAQPQGWASKPSPTSTQGATPALPAPGVSSYRRKHAPLGPRFIRRQPGLPPSPSSLGLGFSVCDQDKCKGESPWFCPHCGMEIHPLQAHSASTPSPEPSVTPEAFRIQS